MHAGSAVAKVMQLCGSSFSPFLLQTGTHRTEVYDENSELRPCYSEHGYINSLSNSIGHFICSLEQKIICLWNIHMTCMHTHHVILTLNNIEKIILNVFEEDKLVNSSHGQSFEFKLLSFHLGILFHQVIFSHVGMRDTKIRKTSFILTQTYYSEDFLKTEPNSLF